MLWSIVVAVAISTSAALFLSRKGPLKKASNYLLSVLMLAGAAGCSLLKDEALGSFRMLSQDQQVWNVFAGLFALAAAAAVAGGIAMIGIFVKHEIGVEADKKA